MPKWVRERERRREREGENYLGRIVYREILELELVGQQGCIFLKIAHFSSSSQQY